MSQRQMAFDYMQKAGVLFLATIRDNKPKNRPIGFKMIVDNQIYFITTNDKKLYQEMMKNTNIELVGLMEDKFIRYYGRVVFDEDEDKTLINAAYDIMPSLKELFKNKKVVIFHVDKATLEYRSMDKIIESINFLN